MSTVSQPETEEEGADGSDLAAEIEAVRNEFEAYRSTVIKPRFNQVNDQLDAAADERAEILEVVENLQSQVNRLESKMEALMGVEDPAASNPQKRCQDLRNALMRRAEARSDDGEGKAAMYYKEVQDLFADTGHGEVKKPECFKAMEDASDAAGFFETSKTSQHGNEVKAVAVNMADLAADAGGSNPTTRNGVSAATDTTSGGVPGNQS